VIAALLVAAVIQGGLEVNAAVDRARVALGGELTLTVRARSRSAGTVEIALPSIAGFASRARAKRPRSPMARAPDYATCGRHAGRADRSAIIGP
jgi:hypothetical protein